MNNLLNEEKWRSDFIREIDIQAYKEHLRKLCLERHRLRFLLQENLSEEEKKLYQDIKQMREKEQEQSKKYTKYMWICCNPHSLITLDEFMKIVRKAMSKLWLQQSEYLYVIEQRGETEEEAGKGFHFHALYVKPDNKKYCEVIREMERTFNKATDTSNIHFYRHYGVSEEEFKRKIGYLVSDKADEAKHLKQRMDKYWRPKVGLQDYYSSENFFSLYKIEKDALLSSET